MDGVARGLGGKEYDGGVYEGACDVRACEGTG